MLASITDVSNWNTHKYRATTGSRNKITVDNPDNSELYFFKESIKKYPPEFWSEIVASKVGVLLGFEVLDYNIGIYRGEVGCLSKSMTSDLEDLVHGINIFSETLEYFKITNRPKYSFQDIENALIGDPNYELYIHKMIDVVIFDTIIGNQDRHLENWALLRKITLERHKVSIKTKIFLIIDFFKIIIYGRKALHALVNKMGGKILYRFSPIYDNGSSLGREIDESKLSEIIKNNNAIKDYLNRARHEIRWEGKKLFFMELVRQLLMKYPDHTRSRITSVFQNYDQHKIEQIINNIDAHLPTAFYSSKLSTVRKQFMILLISLRMTELKEIILQ